MQSFWSNLRPSGDCSPSRAVELVLLIAVVGTTTVLALRDLVWRVYCGLSLVLFVVYCLRLWRLLHSERRYMWVESHRLADLMMMKEHAAQSEQRTTQEPQTQVTSAIPVPQLQHSHSQTVNPILTPQQLQQLTNSLALTSSAQLSHSASLPQYQHAIGSLALPPMQATSSLPVAVQLQQMANSVAISRGEHPPFHVSSHVAAPPQGLAAPFADVMPVSPSLFPQVTPTALHIDEGGDMRLKPLVPYGGGHHG